MADTKITALTAISTVDPAIDVLPIVDVSDTTMAASGTTKKITSNQILGAGGTATLASATITGDLTVRTNQLVVNSTGVGVGTTPSAWSGVGPAIQVEQASLSSEASNQLFLTANGYFAGGQWNYINNASADQYYQISGSHVWRKGTGGAGGTAIGWSTLMTLDSVGLGIGMSPSAILSVLKSSATQATGIILRNADGTNGSSISLDFETSAGTSGVEGTLAGRISGRRVGSGTTGALDFFVNNAGTLGTAKMTIDSSGNVGVGVTPSAWKANHKVVQFGPFSTGYSSIYTDDAANTWFNSLNFQSATTRQYVATGNAAAYRLTVNGQHQWYTDSVGGVAGGTVSFTQAMTLDASGNLLVGTTSGTLFRIISSFLSSSGNGGIKLIDSQSNNTAAFANFSNGTGTLGSITNNNNAGVSYNINSDYRLKESVQPLTGGLARVKALKPSIYKWKSNGSDGEGFLAHELAEVVPSAVTGEKDAVNQDGTIKAQGVDLSKVVPILVAAIQELTARVQTLEAR